MKKKIFNTSSFFLLRVPVFPNNKSELFVDSKNILKRYSENEFIREAIAIASPALAISLNKQTSKNYQEIKSLSNYLNRMSTRATPFGFFSTVSTGQWGNSTSIFFDKHLLHKRARFDMEWVFLYIQKLYQDEKLFLSLPVKTNPLVFLSKERFHLNYIRQTEKKSSSETLSIRSSSLIQNIIEKAKDSITIEPLWLQLQMEMPFLDKVKTCTVISQLIDQQFLLPGIFPSLLDVSLDNSFSKLTHLPGLHSILEDIKKYNSLPLGQGENFLEELRKKMCTFIPNQSCIQVDTTLKGKNYILSNNVLEELNKVLHFLWKISQLQKTESNLVNYHTKFLEKYGESRIVPLIELLDEEKGLGSLFDIENSFFINVQWEKWLNQQWQHCLIHKKMEIILTEKILEPFLQENNLDPNDAPLSIDILCKIFAESPNKIDLGDFLLVIANIAPEGGSYFGRFLDILEKDTTSKLAEFFKLEEGLEPNSRFVELSYLPTHVRHANVMVNPCLRNYRLDIEEGNRQKGSLTLEDIYVGATKSRFYLTDKDSCVNIITRVNNRSNLYHAPIPLKFMRHVTLSQYQNITMFKWGSIKDTAIFLPRVKFSQTILSPAQWKVDAINYKNKMDEKNLSTFIAWADEWALPDTFFLAQDEDQLLLMNRTNANDLEEILSKLKNGISLTFVENFEGAWLEGNEGGHFCEISVPFIKNLEYARKKIPFEAQPFSLKINEVRKKFPGSNWIYFKIYLEENNFNEFLLRHLVNFMESLLNKGLIFEWFFVRYKDSRSHIRLRMQSHSSDFNGEILKSFEEKFKAWENSGWLSDTSLSIYEREIERYGGIDLIDVAESFFFTDTIGSLSIIYAAMTKKIQCELVVFHALSIVHFLSNFGLNEIEMILFLEKLALQQDELIGFRQHKKNLTFLIESLNDSECQLYEIHVLRAVTEIYKEKINLFYNAAKNLKKEQIERIIKSFLHMHCNRLGCQDTEEKQAKLYALHALKSMINQKIHSNKCGVML